MTTQIQNEVRSIVAELETSIVYLLEICEQHKDEKMKTVLKKYSDY